MSRYLLILMILYMGCTSHAMNTDWFESYVIQRDHETWYEYQTLTSIDSELPMIKINATDVFPISTSVIIGTRCPWCQHNIRGDINHYRPARNTDEYVPFAAALAQTGAAVHLSAPITTIITENIPREGVAINIILNPTQPARQGYNYVMAFCSQYHTPTNSSRYSLLPCVQWVALNHTNNLYTENGHMSLDNKWVLQVTLFEVATFFPIELPINGIYERDASALSGTGAMTLFIIVIFVVVCIVIRMYNKIDGVMHTNTNIKSRMWNMQTHDKP
jgi:hypothetical protein